MTPDLDQCQGTSVPIVDEPVMGLTEIAEFLGVTRQRVHQLAQQPGFPAPIARLSMGQVWKSKDVEEWARETGRLD